MVQKAIAVLYWIPVPVQSLNEILLVTQREVLTKHNGGYVLGIPILTIMDEEISNPELLQRAFTDYRSYMAKFHPDLMNVEPTIDGESATYMLLAEEYEWVNAYFMIHPQSYGKFCFLLDNIATDEVLPFLREIMQCEYDSSSTQFPPEQWQIGAYCSFQLPKKLVTNNELKEAMYPCRGAGFPGMPMYNKVAYAIVNDWVIFTGIEDENRTTTVNAAESIVAAIAEQEQIEISKYRWFDLQTRSGYSSLSSASNDYDFDELEFKDKTGGPHMPGVRQENINRQKVIVMNNVGKENFIVAHWHPTSLPDQIRKLFLEYII